MAVWDRITSRGDVEDRRGMAPVAGGISIVGVGLMLLVNYLNGGSVMDVLPQILEQVPLQQSQSVDPSQFAGQDAYEVFASSVVGSGDEYWSAEFQRQGNTYNPPKLVLFRQATNSACGTAASSVGPHYCPLDSTIYLDETFFDELTNRLGAQGGDVAEAYVIAHEMGHHVQNELGLLDNRQTNADSIATELQADYFAGLWADSIRHLGVFEPGEIAEAMDAAAAVGDDRIQERVTGQVNPESWTHGSAEQRVAAFTTGYESGDFNRCLQS